MVNLAKRIPMWLAPLFVLLLGGVAHSQPGIQPWQIGMQEPVTEVARDLVWFNAFTLWIIIPITIFVLILLAIVIIRFNRKTNPTPSNVTHNTLIEIVWTVVPIIILLAIAVPSWRLLEKQLVIPKSDYAITAIGHQWYWEYSYAANEDVNFDSQMLDEEDRLALKPNEPRLLAVDNDLVVPVNKVVRLTVTAEAEGVLHALAVPAFGIRIDAVPARSNETWFKAEKTGIYYGQCSELCGKDHSFMPIAVRVVSQSQFDTWLIDAATDIDEANKVLREAIKQQAQAHEPMQYAQR